MRILHTADWHIGKVLHKYSLQDEMELFLDWLIDVIDAENIDVLLVSGDIFDVANPSIRDRRVYYKFLGRLIGNKVQVIITGGNHDSIGMLDAPQDILGFLNIKVIGGAKENLKDELVEVQLDNGESVVVAAVPFLRDRDLRNRVTDKEFMTREDAIRLGIEQHYSSLGRLVEEYYPGVPAIAMGHLYARGVSTSESERDIHLGNAAAIESSIFPVRFGYVALGHIHRPQIIGNNEMIRYCGSPISLSFSEKEDMKCILIIDLVDGEFTTPKVITVPKKRAMVRFKGNFETVRESIEAFDNPFELTALLEVEVREDTYSATVLSDVQELVSKYNSGEHGFRILKNQTQFLDREKDTADLFQKGTNIEDLRPIDVFKKRLDQEGLEVEQYNEYESAFLEILESLEDENSDS